MVQPSACGTDNRCTMQATKRLIDAALPVTPAATLEPQAGALCGSTEDANEGRASFLERRPPRYQGALRPLACLTA